MKTKILSVLIIFLSIAIVTGCSGNVNNPDALKFKQDYESLNGKTINDKKVRTVKINQNNPLIYKNAEDFGFSYRDPKGYQRAKKRESDKIWKKIQKNLSMNI